MRKQNAHNGHGLKMSIPFLHQTDCLKNFIKIYPILMYNYSVNTEDQYQYLRGNTQMSTICTHKLLLPLPERGITILTYDGLTPVINISIG